MSKQATETTQQWLDRAIHVHAQATAEFIRLLRAREAERARVGPEKFTVSWEDGPGSEAEAEPTVSWEDDPYSEAETRVVQAAHDMFAAARALGAAAP